jgi:diguanylate cyclase (GGDEF)-like protein
MREKYRYYAEHDYLTKLLNRQGLEEWYSAFTNLGDQAVMMIDIDHFKRVNDSYGHDIGDLVLASVAQRIEMEANTKVCRWGGEEFVVWFPEEKNMCDPERVLQTAIRNGQ